jgi:hypothetical protein
LDQPQTPPDSQNRAAVAALFVSARSLKIGWDSESYPGSLFVLMSSIFNSVVAPCIFLMVIGTPSIKAAPQGFIEGHLKIIVIRAVEPDNMPSPENYAEYPLIIPTQEGRREVARLTADKSGNYRVALPPGAYILALQERSGEERAAERIHANQQPFTVIPHQTVRVDMRIFIGPVKGQASAYSG